MTNIRDRLYKQLDILSEHPDFNESCTIIDILDSIKAIEHTENINKELLIKDIKYQAANEAQQKRIDELEAEIAVFLVNNCTTKPIAWMWDNNGVTEYTQDIYSKEYYEKTYGTVMIPLFTVECDRWTNSLAEKHCIAIDRLKEKDKQISELYKNKNEQIIALEARCKELTDALKKVNSGLVEFCNDETLPDDLREIANEDYEMVKKVLLNTTPTQSLDMKKEVK